MKEARVNDLLNAYRSHGMAGVARYLSDEELKIEENSWVGKMKRLLDSQNWGSMEAEIASLINMFNLNNQDGRKNIGTDNSGEGS